jgi:hypothetical protein
MSSRRVAVRKTASTHDVRGSRDGKGTTPHCECAPLTLDWELIVVGQGDDAGVPLLAVPALQGRHHYVAADRECRRGFQVDRRGLLVEAALTRS